MRTRQLNVWHSVSSMPDHLRVMLDCSREDLADLGGLLYRMRQHLEYLKKLMPEHKREMIEEEFIGKSEAYRLAIYRALKDIRK
jgi:lipoate synthase